MPWLNYVRSLLLTALLAAMALAGTVLVETAQAQRAKVEQVLVGTAQARGAKAPQAKVEQITLGGTAENPEVEIRTSGAPVSPNTQLITGPDRIIVDFPGALPSSALRALKMHDGPLKSVRSGLFFENPPITRVVLDLAQARAYRIVTEKNVTVIKLGANAEGNNFSAGSAQAAERANPGADAHAERLAEAHEDMRANVHPAALVAPSNASPVRFSAMKPTAMVATANVSSSATVKAPGGKPFNAVIAPEVHTAPVDAAQETPAAADHPNVNVSYENGMLRIHSDKASLSQVLFEVQLKTQADIPIPSGAEQEKVVADIGPGPARDVLSALLNGSPYNFIFVGNENSLERVILTRRDPGTF